MGDWADSEEARDHEPLIRTNIGFVSGGKARMAKKKYALVPSEREKECTKHLPHWTGTVPCTGRYVCYLCGEEVKDR